MKLDSPLPLKSLLLLGVFALSAGSCATRPRLALRSTPEGAQVTTRSGESLGVTPLVLEGEALEKARVGSRAEFAIGKVGFQKKQVSFELQADNQLELALETLDPAAFSRSVVPEYSKELNALIRDALQAQAQLLGKRTAQGEGTLQKLAEQYPTIGGPQVLLAQVALSKGDRELARKLVRRALLVDPDDAVAQRLGKQLDISVAATDSPASGAMAPVAAPAPAPAQGGSSP